MEQLKMHSFDNVKDNIQKVGTLFPNCITEKIYADGKIDLVIDFDILKQELSNEVVEGNQERYQFTWPDKKKSMLLANSPIAKTLRPCKEESVDFDNTENLYIEGDNLEVLKLLQETYLGKIKMIYIDPPYNTGNDFVYEDNFAQKNSDYLENSGQFDEEGNRLVKNLESNGRFHTDWLKMMYPRLKLARNLLTEDGVIFISIDDNEVHNLRKLCNEIFGEKNFIACFSWKKKAGGANDSNSVAVEHEYVISFQKNENGINKIPLDEKRILKYNLVDEKIKTHGKYLLKNLHDSSLQDSVGLHFDIICPDNTILLGKDYQWKCNKETFNKRLNDNRIVFKKIKNKWTVNYKIYLNEEKGKLRYDENGHIIKKGKNISSIILDVLNKDGNLEMKELFGKSLFSYPKSYKLIKKFLLCATKTDDIILDFFSGSSTTAHAIMKLNADSNCDNIRKFIMVQIPEKIDSKTDAYKEGYRNICEIGKERIRRAGKKIKVESSLTTQDLDVGFRVLKCDSTNMKNVYYKPEEYEEDLFDSLKDNIKEDRTSEDLLFQVMLDLGVLLSSQIEESTIDNKKIYNVADGYLIAYFDENITEDIIIEIAKQKPYYFVMRDSSLAGDNVLTNFDQLFNTFSPDTIRKVL